MRNKASNSTTSLNFRSANNSKASNMIKEENVSNGPDIIKAFELPETHEEYEDSEEGENVW